MTDSPTVGRAAAGVRTRTGQFMASVGVVLLVVGAALQTTPSAASAVSPHAARIVSEPSFGRSVTIPGSRGGPIACPSPTSCTVVVENDGVVLARTETKDHWTSHVIFSPTSSESSVQLVQFSCQAVGDCVLLGYYATSTDQQVGFVVAQVAGKWSAPHTLAPPKAVTGSYEAFWALSCYGVGLCVALGSFNYGPAEAPEFLVVREQSTSHGWSSPSKIWAPSEGPDSAVKAGLLSCVDGGDCASLEEVCETDGAGACAWLYWWDVHGTWIQSSGPSPSLLNFHAIDCWAVGHCIAVGNTGPTWVDMPGDQGFFVYSKGDHWGSPRDLSFPTLSPSEDFGEFGSVSCPSATQCTAGGTFGNVPAAITTRNGIASSVAYDPAFLNSNLTSTSCPALSECVAQIGGALVSINPTQHFTIPGPPINVTATTNADNGVTISWSPPLYDGGAPVSAFEVTLDGSDQTCSTGSSGDDCTLSNLTPDQTYIANVKDSTSIGRSPANSVSFTIP
jgi:hypothetical protein